MPTRPRPSPVVVAGAILLAIALTATALAGPGGTKAVTKAKVKQIVKRQIAKKAPGLSVAAADSLHARALIRPEPLTVSNNRNIAQVQVDRPGPGRYCFDLDFAPSNVQVTQETDGINERVFMTAVIDPLSRVPTAAAGARRGGTFNRCDPGTDIYVESHSADAATGYVDVPFFIAVSR